MYELLHELSNDLENDEIIQSSDSWNKTQMHNTSFHWFSMDLPLFLPEGFRFISPIKNTVAFILGNFRISYFS